MVCDRCRLAVEGALKDMDLTPALVRLGEVDRGDVELAESQLELLRNKLESLGFELISDRKSQLVENAKKHIIDLVQSPGDIEKMKLSEFLSEKLLHDYTYISNLFSSVEGVTLEQYFIHQKIEKAKELLIYDELTLTEIAYRLGYSSVAHLSRQFKKVTGETPSQFKALRDSGQRTPLDKV
jgi:YesN/AraC family two-component response regulator